METSISNELKSSLYLKTRKLLTLFTLFLISLSTVIAQPVWISGPTAAPRPTTVDISFQLNAPSNVYFVAFNFFVGCAAYSAGSAVKFDAINGAPSGCDNGVINYSAGELGSPKTFTISNFSSNRNVTIFIVAQLEGGGPFTAISCIHPTTLPCPKIQLFTFFGNLGECVNLGAQGMFQAAPLGLLPTGVLKGTTWTVDWGDGSPVWTYTSTADDDIPPVQLHTFSAIANCAYQGTWTVKNPCNEFLAGTSMFVVHGRDIPTDGDGLLRMEETSTNTPDIIYLCEGISHTITVTDISQWNCQTPVVPFPLNSADYDNDSPRTLQFVYGETPAGAIMNTITGNVIIGGSNTANAANGYIGPVITPVNPPNPGTVSETITIPATSVVGQQFYVYLKNWNKCNPYGGDPNVGYEYEDFIIEIIDAPPAPAVVTPLDYCFGAVTATITVTPGLPGNTINWYGDAGLTTLLYTGTTYAHGQTAAGTYNYWVTETSGGNGCEGPAAQITMNIYAAITNNNVAAPQTICYNTVPAGLTGTVPGGGTGIYGYQWQSSPDNVTFNNIAGATAINYAPPALTATTWYRRIVNSGPCTSISGSIQITVYGNLTAGTVQSAQSICYNTAPAALTQATAPTGGTGAYTYQWQDSPDNVTFTDIGGATASSFSPPVLTANRYYRRRVTSGSCGTVNSASILITVYANLTAGTVGSAQTICYNTIPAAFTQLTAPAGGTGVYTYQWQSSPDNSVWTSIGGATGVGYTSVARTVNTYFRRQVTSGSCGTVSSPSFLVTVYANLTAGTIGTAQSICYNTAPAALTQLTAPSGGTGAYTYQWQDSPDNVTFNNIGGATGAGFAPPVLTATRYYRRNVTSGTCGTVSSASVTITVYGNLTAGTIQSAQSICYNTAPAQLTQATAPTGGTGAYTYQWQDSPDNVTFNNIGGATASSYSPPVLTANRYYRRSITSGTCGTVNTPSILITVYANLTPGSIGSAQAICYNTIPVGLTQLTAPAGGTGAYTYQWQNSADNVTFNNIGGATAVGFAPPALTVNTYYRRNVTSGSCGTVSSASVLISINPLPTPVISGETQPCLNNTKTYSTPNVGGHTYSWSVTNGTISGPSTNNTVNIQWNIASGPGTVRVTETITATGCLLQTPAYNVTVNPAAPGAAGAITGLANVCDGQSGVNYSITAVANASNYVWTVPAGVTIVSGQGTIAIVVDFALGAASPRTISVYPENGCGAGAASNIIVNISAPLTAGSIGTAQSICYNTAPAALTQLTAPTGGPGGYAYQWQSSPDNSTWTSIGGATAVSYAPPVLTASTYYRRQVTSGTCGTVNTGSILITVYGNLTAGTIGTAQTICYNTIPAPLTELTAAAGGPGGYTYQWQDSPDNITFTNIGGATGVGYAPPILTASRYYRRQVTSGTCGTINSASILITVNGILTAGTIGTAQSICYNTAPSALTQLTAPSGGTGVFTYQWQDSPDNVTFNNIAGATAVGFAPPMLTATTYYRRNVTSGTCGTVTSASITITVYGNLTAGTTGTAQSICYNTVPAALTQLTAPTGGTGVYTYQWQSSPDNATWTSIGGATAVGYAPTALSASTYYRRQVTSGSCGTVNNASILITVYGNLTAGTIGTAQTICYNTAPAALTELIAPTGGPGGYTYQWQSSPDNATWTSIGGATAVGYAPAALTVNTYYRRQVTSGTCGTVNSGSILITVYGNLTAGTIGTAQSICYNTIPAALTVLTAPSGGTGTYTYQWQSSPDNAAWTSIGGATAVGYAPAALSSSTYYRRQVTSGSCGTVNSASIFITVYGNLTSGTIGSNQSICYNTAPAVLTELTAPTGGPGGYTYQWQSSPDNSTWNNIGGATAVGYAPAALSSSTYYRRQVTSGTCGTVSSASILITVYGNLTPGTIGSNQSICYNIAPVAFTNSASPTGGTGLTYQWQNSPSGLGTWVNIPGATALTFTETTLLTASTDYRRVTTSASGCGTVNSNIIIVTVKQLPAITAGQNPSTCSGIALNYQILLDNFVNPGDNVTFTWPAPVHSAGVAGGTARAVGTSANITDTYTNTSGGVGTITYAVTPVKDGCTGPTVNVVVSVGSEPVLDPGLNNTVCSNAPTGLLLKEAAGSVFPTHYNIISVTIAGGLIADISNAVVPNAISPANYLSADKFTNLTGADKTVTYRVQPVLAPNCFGASADVVITIRPQPVIQPGQTRTTCSGVAIGKEILLIPANTPAGTLFNWGLPLISDASVQGTAGVNVTADPSGTVHINDLINNYSSAPITATYTITPVSQFGCAGTAVPVIITINQEPVPLPISGRIALCAGDKNVVYNVNPVGGSSFHWTVAPAVGSITFDFNTNAILIDAALAAGSGNISVYETNSLGCSGDPSNLLVTVYTQPAPENITGDAIVCALSTHTYNVTNRVGSIYNWTVPGGAAIIGDPSASSVQIIFGNVGGTILVRETNIAGCITNHNPFAVTVNPLPTAIISNGGNMCDGGTRPLSVAFTGTAPFNFTYAINGVSQAPISTSSNPYTINATLAGTYTIVNVTDNTGCTNTGAGSTTITYFPKPTGIISGGGELCRGSSATLTMTFTGVAPFTFTYTDGTTPVTVTAHPNNVYTASVSPLITSTYTLTSLTDFNNCVGVLSGSALINVNQPPSLSLTGTNLICYNVPTGAVDMIISDGTAPFGIAWTGPNGFTSPTEDISGLNEGYYAVTVTDSKGCIATANITLTQPPVLNGALARTNVTCFNANDGTITISGVTGGTGTYEYTINGGTSWEGSGIYTGLAPGTYNVQIRDLVNPTCILTLNPAFVITQPAQLAATVGKTDITCFGANNGSIIISGATGGYGTYQYTINGGTNWVGSGNFTNLTPGTYNIQIRDAANTACVIVLNGALVVTEPPVLSATVNRTNITCFGSSDGAITISAAAGGHGTYEYSINGGGSWQATGTYSGLTPGTYNVQIRDAAFTGCYIVLNNALVLTQPAVLTATLASTNVTCNAANDGTISITGASGGYGTYEYSVNGGGSWQLANIFTSMSPGTYDVRIRDAANTSCVIILNAGLQITEPAALMATVIDTDITCFGANDGVITITNSAGGYGTFQYSINGGSTWQDSPVFPALSTGSYDVRIRDRAHTACVVILDAAVLITAPAVMNATVTPVPVSCNGSSDGRVEITAPTGGYGSYQYSINAGTTWQASLVFTSLAPGSYTIRMRDAIYTACFVDLNPVIVTQPAVLDADIASTNVTCFGGADGTIIITNPSGGYGTYEYSVNGGGSWQLAGNFTGLGQGTYNVQIRDAAHASCVIVLNNALVITQPAILRATVTPTMVTCFSANDGIINITNPLGGYGTYEYSNNGGTSWQASGTFSGLAPANYDVRIRDAVNTACEVVLNPGVAITEPAVLSAVVASVNISCTGSNSGIITISSPSGGYGTYEYSVNGGTSWQVSGTFSSLAPGFYDVRIRDRAHIGCVIVLDPALEITEAVTLSATVASTNVSCNGANDGTITISGASGGTGTYGYTINGGASWQTSDTFTNVAPGTYNVRIRDAASITCEIVLNPALVITQPAKLAAAVANTNVTCYGANDGTITITSPTGGYGTYEYSIDGGANWQASGNFAALAPGFFNVQIRDAAHPMCIVTLNGSLRITEPPQLAAAVSKTDVTCFGANDGRITISGATGGYGTYEYSISGGGSWQLANNFTNLGPSTYDVRIRDAANTACVITLNGALVITEPAQLAAAVGKTDVTCFGSNNGIITITGAAGGYGTYEYSINGGTNWSGLNNFTNLAPGTYDVRIRDAAHTACTVILNAALTITQPAVLKADVARTNVTCFGVSDGTITITNPTGGYGTFEYSINGGGSWQASGMFTALAPGNYNVQIRDAAQISCVIILDNSLQITQPPMLNAVVLPTMVTCNGANDGIINITAPTGGYGTYEYSITGGTSWQVSGTFNGVAPGTYDVRIRDASNIACSITLNPALTITEPAILNGVVTGVNVTCFGANNGMIIITSPTGGYGTYDYSHNGGAAWQISSTFSSLAPGTYDVRIRDRAHPACVIILNAALVITEPAVLSATVTPSMVTCNGANDGIITITNPLGGYGSYSYTINGGATWQSSGTFNYLAPGTYNVRIRDAVNITCEIILNPALLITQPAKLAAAVGNTNVTCYGANDGTITITAPVGGYGTYEYSINGGLNWQAGGSFTALAPGFYNIQIRDAANPLCVVILNGSLRISEPPVLTANVSRVNVTCNGSNDGTITITSPMGGYGTYEYSIDGGAGWQASGSFVGLAPGSYNVQIRDAAQTACVIVLNPALVITEPAILTATVTSVNVSCFGANDGSISISGPTGGYGIYQYSVNGGTTWQGFGNFTNLIPGTYDVRIRDAANITCVITLNPALVITQPALLAATVGSTNVTCFGGNDGTITINGATGGYGTYEYSINGGGSWQASGSFAGLTPGSYNILIRDAAHTGCIIVLNNSYIITQPGMLSATISKTDVSCNGDNDGTISITAAIGGYGTYEYTIDGGGSWQVSGNYTNLTPGSYDIRIRDAAHPACSVILYPNLVITEPLTLTMSSTGDVLLDCFGDMDAMGTFFASGGTMPYTFLVVSNTTGGTIAAPGFNSQTFFNAGAGSITVQVVDFNGCSAQGTINITQPAALNPGAIAADQVVCYGDNPAMLTETSAPNGGPGAYNFQWQSSTNIGGPFINIAGANANQYTPPAGATYTLYYRRMVTSGICIPVYSNVVEVLVNPRPVAFLTGGATICPAQSSVIRVTMLAGTGPFTVEIANLGIINNYVSGADIVVTPAVTTVYSLVRVRDANNCEVVAPSTNLNGTATVIVSDLPVITSFTPSPAVCEFTLASFRVTATGTNLTYQWFVNEGSGFNAVVDGGTYFGAMTPTLQVFNTVRTMNGYVYHVVVSGCGTSVTSADATFTVNTAPEITLHPKDSTICLSQNAVMEADATGTAVTWQWYVNKGAGFVVSVDDAYFNGSATKTLTITNAQATHNNWVFRAVATGICGVPVNTNFAVLRVVNPPAVTLQPVATTICENGSTSFLGNGTGYTTLQWQVFSGGVWTNLTDNATYIGVNTQQLAIMNAPVGLNGNQYRLALITGCATTYTNGVALTVNANPVVDFSAIDPIAACGGVPIVINGNPTGGSGIYTQHRWTGDVGPLNNYTVQSPTFNSLITGTYNLNYRVTDSNGCTANDGVAVTVDSPSAQFTQDVDYGCTPLTVTFTKDMTGISKWWWNFDDGSPLDSLNANPVHTFVNTVPVSIEYYDVKLRVRSTGGCYAEFTSTITVYPAVDATFTPNLTVVCSGNSITFTAVSGASRYFWEYGDGASGYATNVSTHLYTNFTTAPVVRTVRLTTTSFYNCSDVKTFDITVMPVPIPQFTAAPLTQVFNAAGNPVTFTNTTNAGTWNWLWNFGDNTTSTDENPVHSYTDVGTYTVTLIANNANCSDSVKHNVSVVPPAPFASFDSIPSGCAPLYVVTNNTSLNTDVPGTTYLWDFGDGSKSTAKNPTYTYFTAGTYRIELVVTGPGGTSMATQVVNAYPSPKAYFEVTPAMVYVNDERIRVFNLSQGATSYLWDFGDGDTSKVKEPFHRYMEEGVFDITLWAYSDNGCTDTYILSPAVTVEPVGELRFATVFQPNKTGPIERTDLPTGGTEVDQFFYPPIRQKVLNYKLQIFNRLGVLIFESQDINIPWNGYYKGKLCQQGVYVWYVEGKYADGKPFKLVGNVTLLQ